MLGGILPGLSAVKNTLRDINPVGGNQIDHLLATSSSSIGDLNLNLAKTEPNQINLGTKGNPLLIGGAFVAIAVTAFLIGRKKKG